MKKFFPVALIFPCFFLVDPKDLGHDIAVEEPFIDAPNFRVAMKRSCAKRFHRTIESSGLFNRL